MMQEVIFRWLLFSCCLIVIFESAQSSFISSTSQHSNGSFQSVCRFTKSFGVGAGSRIYRERNFTPITTTTTTATNSEIKLAFSDVSASYRNDTSPLFNNGNRNDPLEIPIIGPLLDVENPIIIGNSIWLNPPTPLQWKALEVSVAAQYGEDVLNLKSGSRPEANKKAMDHKINLASVTKSPMVAILHSGGKEYATIGAIQGITTQKEGSIDTNDAESFRESLASLSSPYYSDLSKIRLMAIGRAKLSHFNTKFLKSDSIFKSHEFDEMKNVESNIGNSVGSEPLLVARMELLSDSTERGEIISSPVHALNRLSTFAQRVRLLHDDRQRIVRGLQAAQSRLEMAMDSWEDWDGIGHINNDRERFSSRETTNSDAFEDDDQTRILNQFLEEYNIDENPSPAPTYSLPLSAGAARCLELDNYGLGSTSSAFVSLTSMADVLKGNLESYYSPTLFQSEEFEYEIFSWCVLQSLESYLRPHEIYEALYKCTNTCARLEILHNAMSKHKMNLNELAQAKSLELRNCGEECDLF